MAKHERHASFCDNCNFETKPYGKVKNHVAKHSSQESPGDKSKANANITSNLKEHMWQNMKTMQVLVINVH